MYEGPDSGYEDDPQSELHLLCKTGTLGNILTWLQSSDEEIEWFYEGETALHACVLSGRDDAPDVVSALVEHGCDVNAQNMADGNTALHLCVLHGSFPKDFDIVVALRSKNCDLGVRNKPYIIESVLNSDYAALQRNIQLGGDPNYLNKESDTALNLCIKSDDLRASGQMARCVQMLVDLGAESNIQDVDGRDACRIAEDKGYEDILLILTAKPKKPPLKKKESRKSVVFEPAAPKSVSVDIDDDYPVFGKVMLSRLSCDPGDQHVICKDAEYDALVITRGGSLPHPRSDKTDQSNSKTQKNQRTSGGSGNTSLHLCAERDYGETAKLLLDNHIDYTVKNNEGKTAYDLAQDLDHQSVMAAIEQKREEVQDQWQKAGRKAKWCTIL
ncbi:hypothetical protein EGW08_021578 [Elysia chlorotica]|uniref:Uncharacterized protein n=1 Tax=Elysia chlorotica TaxID=188477 RepID=A0A433SN65_ELYCH|nr:hypothetical protein EGW08_021578 [Elysia chlorotica]